ncbi:MAG: L,D-transpeptidase family protein [Proteobacteria bacterium]|nr:L,D-transpeptidase family protein [Pseudomonadota bacterium]
MSRPHTLTSTARAVLLASAASLGVAFLFAAPPPPIGGRADASVESAAPVKLGRWSAENGRALIAEIAASASEGLDPADYSAAALEAELNRSGGGETFDRMADAAALKLAHDYLLGAIDNKAAYDWHIDRADGDPSRLAMQLQQAVASGRIQPWLRSLLPSDSRYAALRTAYAETPEANFVARGRLRANLERWRWMPRDLGADHIYVNVPSYTLQLVENGKPVTEHVVVVGARATPTPAIGYAAQSVVLNPWWTPPKSIRVSGKGFVRDGGALRQPPGPRNALGRVKIDLPNPHAIYLHDTPSKQYFEKTSRAYSHGCIRVQNAEGLAAELVKLDTGSDAAVERGLKTYATQTLKLREARPVWLVYFTADIGPDGKLRMLEDPYNRDSRLIAQLDTPVRLAMR